MNVLVHCYQNALNYFAPVILLSELYVYEIGTKGREASMIEP